MKLIEALDDPIFKFPLEVSSYFPTHLNQLLSRYLETITAIDDEYAAIIRENLPAIRDTCDNLQQATHAVFNGNTARAYEIFSQTVSRLEPFLLYPNKNAVEMNPMRLFKARRTLDGEFGLGEMFHVPFEKRYEITTTRFSLPGVPCLYLGNSIYTCWEELDRPSFSQMPVSRFELSGKNLKFLDFSNQRDFIKHSIIRRPYQPHPKISEEREKELFDSTLDLVKTFVLPRYLQALPLMVACYIKVFNQRFHFKPEYIFPQMVMQWIMTQDDIDGVKYLSTKCKDINHDFYSFAQSFVNYAIPIQSFKETGYCEIMTKRIGLTDPITFGAFSTANPELATQVIDFEKDVKNKFFHSPIFVINPDDAITRYSETQFGILEHELMKMPIKHIEP
jgi:hypothetical protein